MSLDDLMHGQSAVLARSVRGEIELDKFVEVSLSLVKRYIDLYDQKYRGRIDIDEIVKNIGQYEYGTKVEHLLDKCGIIKKDKERHVELARWYNEFFVKYYVLTQMEEMQTYLEGLRGVIEEDTTLSFPEAVQRFNETITKSGIRHAEKYLLEIPNKDVLFYHQQALKKYKNKQLIQYW